MYDFNKIKLVIWDLDETFWKGILSEGEVEPIEANLGLVRRLTDIGIVNSICSKNDIDKAEAALKKMGMWDLFVFPSVNWEPKGSRIAALISDMQLRPVNALFIDDNPSNLEEAKFFAEGLMTALPEELPNLIAEANACTKADPEHKRLNQYKILEEKHSSRESFSSNEEFLMNSNIRVSIAADCLLKIDRIHDLLERSNQLNFTKVRQSVDELRNLFEDKSVDCGYVSVKDNFGDYGIIGFYALQNNKLIHFCFSCRTLGMGIEQYVYIKLGRPKLDIVGEVVSDISMTELPRWINQENEIPVKKAADAVRKDRAHSVLMKGPCDLFQILPYIAEKELIDTEFTYTRPDGVTIESTGHTTHIVEALRLTEEQKRRVIAEVPFADMGMYSDKLYSGGYKVIVISILADANLGVYRRKGTGERLAFLEGFHPITDKANWDAYIKGEYNHAGFDFTAENLQEFSEKYEFIGINSPEDIVDNLRYIRSNLPKDTMLAVMLGGELYYEKNTFPAYENRHIVHKKINEAIRNAAEELDIKLIDVNKYLVDQSSFYDHFNHYIKPVYYALAGEIVDLVNEKTGSNMKETAKSKMLAVRVKEVLAPIYYKLRKSVKRK